MITDASGAPVGAPPAIERGPGPPADAVDAGAADGPAVLPAAGRRTRRRPDPGHARAGPRRELRRLERAAELAAFDASEAQDQAERDADDEHFTPPEPPPLPRPKAADDRVAC